jgi:hypothetical protein
MVVASRHRDPEAVQELVGFLESKWEGCFGKDPCKEKA